MTGWIEAVQTLRSSRQPGVLVTVTHARGHAPREAGAKMVVSASTTWGTVGGGNLEEEAVRRARLLLESGSATPTTFVSSLSDKAPIQHGVQCCGGEVTVLLEPLRTVPSVALFGLGHVGSELARILARHDIELHLIDSRQAQLTAEALAGLNHAVAAIHAHHVPVIPELVLAELPAGTAVFVLTHDHAEDLAIIDAALRCDHLGPIGLIGSSAKWRRFRSKLEAAGLTPDRIDRVQTPIGLPGVTTSKEPAAIAVSVAAGWLAANDRDRRGSKSAPKMANP